MDEEVIFEGDPLYNYLQETDYQEFEYVPKKIQENIYIKCKEKISQDTFISIYFKQFIEKTIKMFAHFFSLNKFHTDYCRLTSLKLIQNGLLFEDLIVLENLSSFNEIHLSQNKEERDQMKLDLIKKYQLNWENISKKFSLILCLTFSILFMLWYFQNVFHDIAVLCMVLLFTYIVTLCLRVFTSWQLWESQCKLDSFVVLSNNLFKSCSKSQKILNEIDFISKEADLNFLTATRNALYAAQEDVIDDFITFLSKWHEILKQKGLDYNLNTVNALFDARFRNGGDFVKVSDNTELTRLKVKREILSLQYSGFVTEFILFLEGLNYHGNNWSFVSSIFSDILLIKLKYKTIFLDKCIILTNRSWFVNDEAIGNKFKSKNTKLMDTIRVTNSLSFHGKSFLASFYRWQEFISNLYDKSVNVRLRDEDILTEVKYFCDEMSAELQSCFGCIDEINAIISTTDDSNTQSLPSIVEPNRRKNIVRNSTIDNTDPIILDEVFEAYVFATKTSIIDSMQCADDSKVERETILNQKSHCKSVLKEMQPILRKRRTMWQKREEIALKRSINAQAVGDDIKESNNCISNIVTEPNCSDILVKTSSSHNSYFGLSDEEEIPPEIPVEPDCEEDKTEDTFKGDGISDYGSILPKYQLSLEERIASWSGNVGLGLNSVLADSKNLRPQFREDVFDAVGEQESDIELDKSSSSS